MTTLRDFPPDSRRVYELAAGYCHIHGRPLMHRGELHMVAKPATITWLKKHHWIRPVTVPNPYAPGKTAEAYRIRHPQLDHLPDTLEDQDD